MLGLFKINQRVVTHYLDGSGASPKVEDVRDDEQLFEMADEIQSDDGSQQDIHRPSCRILVETLLLVYVTTAGSVRSQCLVVDASYDELASHGENAAKLDYFRDNKDHFYEMR